MSDDPIRQARRREWRRQFGSGIVMFAELGIGFIFGIGLMYCLTRMFIGH
jgi:hypothetical protein